MVLGREIHPIVSLVATRVQAASPVSAATATGTVHCASFPSRLTSQQCFRISGVAISGLIGFLHYFGLKVPNAISAVVVGYAPLNHFAMLGMQSS